MLEHTHQQTHTQYIYIYIYIYPRAHAQMGMHTHAKMNTHTKIQTISCGQCSVPREQLQQEFFDHQHIPLPWPNPWPNKTTKNRKGYKVTTVPGCWCILFTFYCSPSLGGLCMYVCVCVCACVCVCLWMWKEGGAKRGYEFASVRVCQHYPPFFGICRPENPKNPIYSVLHPHTVIYAFPNFRII